MNDRDRVIVIQELRRKYKVVELIRIAGIARSTFYYWVKALNRPDKYAEVKREIQKIYHENRGRYGYRRIKLELANRGYLLNHKTVQRLMKQLGLKSLVRPKKYRSYRGQVGQIAPNILQRDFYAETPCRKWVTDVTEFALHNTRIYLSPILDLFNGEIISYAISDRPNYALVDTMLQNAFESAKEDLTGLVLHSDQGWHYQMKRYQKALQKRGIIQSMSRKGNCLDNSVMENFFGLLKSEFFYTQSFHSVNQFVTELKNYIDYYNHFRIKSKLKGLSPVDFRLQSSFPA